MRGAAAAIAVCAVALSAQTAARAQSDAAGGETGGPVQSAVLTLDQKRLFAESLWGKRVTESVAADSRELQAENRTIEAALTAEEEALTARRASLDPQAFRQEADAFDEKVTSIRAAQDAKAREIAGRVETEEQAFLAAALPVIGEVLQSRGAVVVIDRAMVFVSANSIDVTDELILRIDQTLGDGSAPAEATEPAHGDVTEPETSAPDP
jgi:Skp family chaperone for outer membrane proteins